MEWLQRSASIPRFATVALVVLAAACEDSGKISEERAMEHVRFLAPAADADVADVRKGLPQGAQFLAPLWKEGQDPTQDPPAAREGLRRARHKVQDLRVAKSTFFAVATKDGTIIRTNQTQDMMAGRNILTAFPELRQALAGGYTETQGVMTEARGVEGRPDGQWVAAHPVKRGAETLGLYVTGWAWTSYARRLEAGLKSHLVDVEKGKKPLYYVFVVVGDKAYGTAASPMVNAEAIEKLDPLAKVDGDLPYHTQLEITGRAFGLAVQRTPQLGKDVAIAVLRSET